MSCADVVVTKRDSAAPSLCDAFVAFREKRLSERKKLSELKKSADQKKRTETFKKHLRKKFVESARQYLGVPYGKRFHEQEKECECDGCKESGRQLRDDPLFLDCCALVRKCVYDLREDFGFVLGAGNQAYQFDTLPSCDRVESPDQLEPGDLVFFSGEYYNDKCKKQKHDMTHVEIFVGGKTGKAVIGSREKQKWVKEYDTYEFVSKSWKLKELFFVKIDAWLSGQLKSHCKEHSWSHILSKKNQNKNSLFFDEQTIED